MSLGNDLGRMSEVLEHNEFAYTVNNIYFNSEATNYKLTFSLYVGKCELFPKLYSNYIAPILIEILYFKINRNLFSHLKNKKSNKLLLLHTHNTTEHTKKISVNQTIQNKRVSIQNKQYDQQEN